MLGSRMFRKVPCLGKVRGNCTAASAQVATMQPMSCMGKKAATMIVSAISINISMNYHEYLLRC